MRYFSIGFQSAPLENQTLYSNLQALEKTAIQLFNKIELTSIHSYAQADDCSLYRITRTLMTSEELQEKLLPMLPDNVFLVEISEVDPINENGLDKGKPVPIGQLFDYKAQ